MILYGNYHYVFKIFFFFEWGGVGGGDEWK